MTFEWTPFAILYIISGITAFVTAAVAWKHRGRPGAVALCCFMLGAGEWSFVNALEICSVGVEAKTLWSNIEYLGITTVPVAWLAVSMSVAGKARWFSRRNLLLLLAIPAITQVIVWTNGYHGLMRYNVGLDASGPVAVIVKTYGPWFWVWTAYGYTLLVIGTINIMRTTVGLAGLYRAQVVLMVAGLLVPWAVSILYISGLGPKWGPDMTPVALIIAALAAAMAIFRYRLFDIQPIAWAAVVEGMDDGVIVTDGQDRVVAANPAAQAITGWSTDEVVGRDVQEVMARWPRVAQALENAVGPLSELMEDGKVSYEVRFSPLDGPDKSIISRIITIRDVTEQRHAHHEFVGQQRVLAAMEEREALARDLHDNICQVLGYLNLELQSALGRLAQGQTAATRGHIDSLLSVVRNAQAETRDYIRSMMREAESRWEFVPRLQELLRGIESRRGICTALTVSEEISDGIIGHAAALELLRIIQEACLNAAKHAGASHLWVSVELLGRVVEVVVRDDGKGFSVVDQTSRTEEGPAGQSSGGLGLSIMRERAERLGGDFTLRSAPGRGTEVRVCIPVKRDSGSS